MKTIRWQPTIYNIYVILMDHKPSKLREGYEKFTQFK